MFNILEKYFPCDEKKFGIVRIPIKKKRGRKPGSGKKKGYFYDEEEEAFRQYVESKDQFTRDKIFREKLYPAFTKMIESIIRSYGLFTPSEDFLSTFNDAMSFMLMKIEDKFDFNKGKKLYSYAGTICRNYLLYKRIQDMKNIKRTIPYDVYYTEDNPDNRKSKSDSEILLNFNNELIDKICDIIQDLIDKHPDKLTENEIKVGYAIIELLSNWNEIFLNSGIKKINKHAILYFIKEYTLLSTNEIREALKIYRNIYSYSKEDFIKDDNLIT